MSRDDLTPFYDEHLNDEAADDLGDISFGALAKAHDAVYNSIDHIATGRDPASTKLENLRERLKELKAEKASELIKRRNDSDRKPYETSQDTRRSSKHAPSEVTSKRAVTRRRGAIPIQKPGSRDPRFDPLTGSVDEDRLKRNYSFLEDYKAHELKQLKDAIKKTKDEGEREILKRELLSLESKQRAQESKDKQREIVRKHRSQEKELIKQGKQPFYLKKGDQKKMALMERYNGLKGKQLDHVLERKRKKKASKERKNMPAFRRAVE
ncbi:MAG: hypothetical protein M1825_000019 [Sarcosagium campestre]|nr:MAG: hypothetical protein M1825_000019 [Sarcosagium campestre]